MLEFMIVFIGVALIKYGSLPKTMNGVEKFNPELMKQKNES